MNKVEESIKFLENMSNIIKKNKLFFDKDDNTVRIGIKTSEAIDIILEKINNSISKERIQQHIKICEEILEKEMKPYKKEYGIDVSYLNRKEKQELINKRNCLITQIESYKQLINEINKKGN